MTDQWPYWIGALAVSLVAHGMLYARLPKRQWLSLALALGTLLLPLGMLQLSFMRSVPRSVATPLMWAAFTWLGVLYFVLVAMLVFRSLWAVLIALVLASYATWQGVRAPEVVQVSVPIGIDVRIAHISDLHIGAMLDRHFALAVVDAVNALEPNYVCITGDLVDGSIEALVDEVAPLKKLRAPVYVALGNHEYFSDAVAWRRHFETMGMIVLQNSYRTLPEGFDLVGIDELSAPEFSPAGAPDYDRAFAGRDPARPAVVLVHQPRALAELKKRGAALQLSGHTHAGQLWPLHLLALLDQPYVEGLHHEPPTYVYVSPGTGYWGPPMRLFTRAAISLLSLSK